MDPNASRNDYAARMHRVLDYIDRRLEQPLDLEQLAGVANFSPDHFHRLFSAWMGETLGDYLRRRRLEIAAIILLSQPHMSILQVALAVGFGSSEAFSRAFRTRFGCTPSLWRREKAGLLPPNSNPDQLKSKIDQVFPAQKHNNDKSINNTQDQQMNVKLVDRAPVNIAYLRHVGPYGESVNRFWQNQVMPWMTTNNLLGRACFGISHDDPSITAPQHCRYDACVEAPKDVALAGGGFLTTIPGGRYAVLEFEGSVAEIGLAWAALMREWLPASGLMLDARPCFEHYPPASCQNKAPGIFSCEICIPVAPR